MKQFQKTILAVMAMIFGIMGQSNVYGNIDTCIGTDCKIERVNIPAVQPDTHRTVVRYSDLTCGQNALCGTFPSGSPTFETVNGQVGIYYYDTDLKNNLFVPIYSRKAELSGDQYVIPDWDGKVFWMIINPNIPPLSLQPDWMTTNVYGMTFYSNAVFYKQKDKDYSAYPGGAASCRIYLSVDFQNEVTDYHIRLYDQDGNLIFDDETSSPKEFKMGIGDEFDILHWATADDSPGTEWGIALENYIQVTQEPVFKYAGYIPGRDFACTNCVNKIDLPNTDLYFRLQGSNLEPVEPVWSEKIPLGKLEKRVFPEMPALADVIIGLKILTSSAPAGCCFKDMNADNKFGMEDVIWMLQKIAEAR